MSLILEALKKSETQRRLGEAPSLGTPFATARRRRSPLPWLTLAVVLIAAGTGWWLWHATLPAPASGATAPNEHPAHDAARADAGAMPPPRPQQPISAIPPTFAAHATAKPDGVSAAANTTGAALAVKQPPAPAVTGANTPAPAAPAFTARPGETKKSLPPETMASSAAPSAPPAQTKQTARSAPASAQPAAAAEPAELALPTISDFPYDVRHALPDLPISMQVYSSDPSRRFIIINGERKVEGDAIRDVAIREIRANGVVLEFRGQRFLLPRPGS